MRIVYFILVWNVFSLNFFFGQTHKRKSKVSFSKGTLFAYYGYNRAWYSNSMINYSGPGYQFSLSGVKAMDDHFPFDPAQQLNPLNATQGQYNVRAGYYFKNHYSVSIGFDKLKYVVRPNDEVLLTGNFNPGENSFGKFMNDPIEINPSTFFYSNSGLYYLRIELSKSDQWFAAGDRQQFIVSTVCGIGLGGLISDNSFLLNGIQDEKLRSLSGVAVSGHLGVRLEFFKHLFIQTNFSGGLMAQTHVRTRSSNLNSFADQRFGYMQFDSNIGYLFFIRPTNSCNSCPVWK